MKIEKAIYLNSFNFHKVGKENRSFSRIYFGNEFCENLTPEVNELKNIFKIIEKKSINFSFVTPWSTDRGIKKLEKIFDFLPKNTEIIFNDWGVFQLIKMNNSRKKKEFKPILGRLLVKYQKDPRIFKSKNKKLINYLKISNINNEKFQKFLLKNKIYRVEIENSYQGYNFNLNKNIETSLYYPFVYTATGTKCLFKPNDDLPYCSRECQKGYFDCSFGKFHILRRGNTEFYVNKKKSGSTFFKKLNVSREVFSPDLPL